MKFFKILFPTLKFAFIPSAFLAVGLYFGVQSWNSQLYVEVQPSKYRGLASENKPTMYTSKLSHFNQALSKKVFNNLKMTQKQDGSLGIYVGNFLIPNKNNNNHEFVCQRYDFFEMRFETLDVQIHGDPGIMLLQSSCNMEDNKNFIAPFWLPTKSMLVSSRQYKKRDFKFPEEKKFVKTYHIPFHLASEWMLASVRFFNSSEDDGLTVKYNRKINKPFVIKTQNLRALSSVPPEPVVH